MISYFYKTASRQQLIELPQYKKNCWVSLINPSEEELRAIDSRLGLDENLLRDALDPYEVPRIESEDKELYFFTRFLHRTDAQVKHIPILFVLDRQCLLTISIQEFPQLEKLTRKLEGASTAQKAALLGKMLFIIMREYHKLILDVSKKVQATHGRLADIRSKDIVQLVSFENLFHDLLASLIPTHMAVGQLITGKYYSLNEEEKELFIDVQLFINQLIEMSKTNIERVVNIREAMDTILSNNLNSTMKFLAAMTLIFTIPTMIFSFYGMNVALPLQQLPVAHMLIFAGAIALSLLLFFLFIKKRML